MQEQLQPFHYLLLQFEFTARKNNLNKIVARQKVRKYRKFQIPTLSTTESPWECKSYRQHRQCRSGVKFIGEHITSAGGTRF